MGCKRPLHTRIHKTAYLKSGRDKEKFKWCRIWHPPQPALQVEDPGAGLPLGVQAELLGLNRASLYYQPVRPSPREITIKHRIDELYTTYPFYGSRRMRAVLLREGWLISRPTVQVYMRMNIINSLKMTDALEVSASELLK